METLFMLMLLGDDIMETCRKDLLNCFPTTELKGFEGPNSSDLRRLTSYWCDKTCKHSHLECKTLLMHWMEEVLMLNLSLDPKAQQPTTGICPHFLLLDYSGHNEITSGKERQCYLMGMKSPFRRNSQILISMNFALSFCIFYPFKVNIYQVFICSRHYPLPHNKSVGYFLVLVSLHNNKMETQTG